MPIYRCSSPQGMLTRIHCEATGERPSFVNAVTMSERDTRCYGICHNCGRASPASQRPNSLSAKETLAENATQAGLIFAEPGHDQQWFNENRAKLTEFDLLNATPRRETEGAPYSFQ